MIHGHKMKRKILVISPTPTHPVTAGNRARVEGLLTMMMEMGHDVYFLHIESEPGDPGQMRAAWGERFFSAKYTRPRRSLTGRINRRIRMCFDKEARYTFSIDEWYDGSVDAVLSDLQGRYSFDTVIVEYVFFSRALECFDNSVLKLIDTHDAFANRHRHYLEKGQKPKWFSTTPAEEGRGFDRADVVIAIQDEEREIFSRQTRARVITVGHMVPVREYVKNDSDEKRILFVASDNAINVQGIKAFLADSFPEIRRQYPLARLVLVGSVCDAVGDQEGIVKAGRVDDLRPYYEEASLVINPVFLNTGLSIKNLEALGYSKALVTAPVGAEGIKDGIGRAFLVADGAQDFTQTVVRILSDASYAEQLSRAAGQYALEWNKSVVGQLETVLN